MAEARPAPTPHYSKTDGAEIFDTAPSSYSSLLRRFTVEEQPRVGNHATEEAKRSIERSEQALRNLGAPELAEQRRVTAMALSRYIAENEPRDRRDSNRYWITL